MPVGRGLDLKGEAQPEQAPNVDLLVAALIVAHGGSDLEQAVASKHHEDRGKELADHALLHGRYWHQRPRLLGTVGCSKIPGGDQLRIKGLESPPMYIYIARAGEGPELAVSSASVTTDRGEETGLGGH